MPPPPMKCQVQDCEFATAANLATFDQQSKMLELHLHMAHPQLDPTPGAAPSQAAGGPKSRYKVSVLVHWVLGAGA